MLTMLGVGRGYAPGDDGGGGGTTTRDPAFVNGRQTPSKHNLTDTWNTGGTSIERSLAGHLTGKYYWECTVGTAGK